MEKFILHKYLGLEFEKSPKTGLFYSQFYRCITTA